jgi:hypothetical protein
MTIYNLLCLGITPADDDTSLEASYALAGIDGKPTIAWFRPMKKFEARSVVDCTLDCAQHGCDLYQFNTESHMCTLHKFDASYADTVSCSYPDTCYKIDGCN